jgi:hypothetical protein
MGGPDYCLLEHKRPGHGALAEGYDRLGHGVRGEGHRRAASADGWVRRAPAPMQAVQIVMGRRGVPCLAGYVNARAGQTRIRRILDVNVQDVPESPAAIPPSNGGTWVTNDKAAGQRSSDRRLSLRAAAYPACESLLSRISAITPEQCGLPEGR